MVFRPRETIERAIGNRRDEYAEEPTEKPTNDIKLEKRYCIEKKNNVFRYDVHVSNSVTVSLTEFRIHRVTENGILVASYASWMHFNRHACNNVGIDDLLVSLDIIPVSHLFLQLSALQ